MELSQTGHNTFLKFSIIKRRLETTAAVSVDLTCCICGQILTDYQGTQIPESSKTGRRYRVLAEA